MVSFPGTVLKTEVRSLPCPLTDAELLAKGDALANTRQKLKSEKAFQDRQKAEWKERIAALELELDKFQQEIQERREFRDIVVEIVVKDPKNAIVTEVRSDTGEFLRERRMDDDERQIRLPETE